MKYYYHPGMQGQTPPVGNYTPYPQPVMGVAPVDYGHLFAVKEAKKQVRKASNGLGAGLLFVQGIGTVMALLLPVIIDLLFLGASENGGIYYEALEYAVYSPVCILLSMWLGLKIAKGSFSELVPFGKAKPFLWFACILFSFLFVFVGNVFGDIAAVLSPNTTENLTAAMGAEPTTLIELMLNVLYVAAIPALVEELAFRGIALGLLRKYGDGFAILISSLLFGLLHGNLIQIPFAFCVGIALAYTVVRTGSIVPAILIHFINNAMSCLLTYYTAEVSSMGESLLFKGLLYGAWLMIGVFGYLLLRFCFAQKPLDCLKKYEGCLTAGRRTGAFFSGAALIVALVVYVGSAILFAFPLELA